MKKPLVLLRAAVWISADLSDIKFNSNSTYKLIYYRCWREVSRTSPASPETSTTRVTA